MIDTTHILKDAGFVDADAAGTVDSSAKIVDLGAGLVEGHMVVDVTAIEVADNDELYKISLQGSNQSDFVGVSGECAVLNLGAAGVIAAGIDSITGRYKVPFRNEQNGTIWQYVRSYTDVSGTIAAGINFSAHLSK